MSRLLEVLACIQKGLGWFPVVFVNLIAAWSYFAYVVILCFDSVSDVGERVIYLVLFHPLFFAFLISYWKAILSMAGNPKEEFYLTEEDIEKYKTTENRQEFLVELAKDLPVLTTTVNGDIRFCELCQAIKPDRSHHCSICRGCLLKMDHHCPWVNNCVGWGNYKLFFLFLFYAILYTLYCALTSLKYFIKFWENDNMKADNNLHILFLFFIAVMFAVSILSLLGFHTYLLLMNRTTLESFRPPHFASGPDKNGFNLGKRNNIEEVFGEVKWKWMLPVFTTPGDGNSFQTGPSQNPHFP